MRWETSGKREKSSGTRDNPNLGGAGRELNGWGAAACEEGGDRSREQSGELTWCWREILGGDPGGGGERWPYGLGGGFFLGGVGKGEKQARAGRCQVGDNAGARFQAAREAGMGRRGRQAGGEAHPLGLGGDPQRNQTGGQRGGPGHAGGREPPTEPRLGGGGAPARG